MTAGNHSRSTPLRLDLANEWVWQGEQCLPLPPKAFAVLRYLIEHPGRLVSKEELLHAVWPDTVVSEWALTTCVREIRKTLGEKAQAPQYIETVHRRGYRFIAPLTTVSLVASSAFRVPRSDTQDSALRTRHSVLVGRDAELVQLHSWLDKALGGERQIVFVTGEPGIGKSALANAGLEHVGAAEGCWVGRGQCVEQFGAGEPYLPVLEAVGALCQEPGGQQLVTVLQQYAPTWLLQLPAVLVNLDLELLRRKTAGATRQRMLRELTEALEVLTTERPLVLVLEDLHWSDLSTLEFLSYLARRPHACRLLVLGTYRPVEMLTEGHPLKRVTQEIYAHQLGQELALRRLSESEVNAYLTLRFPESVLPTRLGQVLQQRTGGNPLFLTSIVQELTRQEIILQGQDGRWEFHGNMTELERWTPESVRHVLARQRERLAPAERRMLEAASLAGLEFSAATVAAALETETIQVEEHCDRLADQQHFLRLAGISEWPDGTRAARYGFLHALYQEFWHERVSVGHQQQWHLRMGERKEVAYGQRTREIAAELLVHFEQGRDYRRAVHYLQLAGENSVRRNAHQEALDHFTKGLELLRTLPDTHERTQQEFRLQIALGGPGIAIKGFAAPEVQHAYSRALELCRQGGETPQLFEALFGFCIFYTVRAEHKKAREQAEQCLRLAQSVQRQSLLLRAHHVLGNNLFWCGELAGARAHQEQALALYNPQQNPSYFASWLNPGVNCRNYMAFTLGNLGYADQALKRSQEAIALAQELPQSFSMAMALCFAADVHLARGEWQPAQEQAETLITLSTEQGFTQLLADGTMLRGRALVQQGQVEEGIAWTQHGMNAGRATGFEMGRTRDLAGLAVAYEKVGQREKGLTTVAEALALVDKTGERMVEAELYRLKGELSLQSRQVKTGPEPGVRSPESEAEEYFHWAIEIARRQHAKSWELRAVTSLSRLWQRQGKKEEAHKMLSDIYGWFTEGFDTVDLREAKALLGASQ